jgi:hypothetical protein
MNESPAASASAMVKLMQQRLGENTHQTFC